MRFAAWEHACGWAVRSLSVASIVPTNAHSSQGWHCSICVRNARPDPTIRISDEMFALSGSVQKISDRCRRISTRITAMLVMMAFVMECHGKDGAIIVAKSGGEVRVNGDRLQTRGGGTRPRLREGDTIATGNHGSAVLLFECGVGGYAGPNTHLTVLESKLTPFTQTPQPGVANHDVETVVRLRLDSGEIAAEVPSMATASQFSVETPSGTIYFRSIASFRLRFGQAENTPFATRRLDLVIARGHAIYVPDGTADTPVDIPPEYRLSVEVGAKTDDNMKSASANRMNIQSVDSVAKNEVLLLLFRNGLTSPPE